MVAVKEREKLDKKRVEHEEFEVLPGIQSNTIKSIHAKPFPQLNPRQAVTFFFPSNSLWFGFETCIIYQAVHLPRTWN